MSFEGIRARSHLRPLKKESEHKTTNGPSTLPNGLSTKGKVKNSPIKQYILMVAFGTYFFICCVGIHTAQYMGIIVYIFNRDYYYTWMSMTKQYFGLVINTVVQWFCPTVVRVSGDASVRDQLRKTEDGRLESDLPERMVLMANHQIYTDWFYIWWMAYTARRHGSIYIILKESLKYIPFIGPGMLFYGFIFLARNWTKDKPRFERSLKKLNTRHSGPLSGSHSLDPMWLIIFPEGTNISINGRAISKKWAEKSGLEDMKHQLLPRSTGLHFTLEQLRDTVDWLYDLTIAYEGVPPGKYGQDVFSLKALFFEGLAPKSVNLYWRRFAISSIPLEDPKEFEIWLRDRWTEKDALLEEFTQTGKFPGSYPDADSSECGDLTGKHNHIETEVKSSSIFERLLMFIPLLLLAFFVKVVLDLWLGRNS